MQRGLQNTKPEPNVETPKLGVSTVSILQRLLL